MEGGMVVVCGKMFSQVWSMVLSGAEDGDHSEGKIWHKPIVIKPTRDRVKSLGWEQGQNRDDVYLLETIISSCRGEGNGLHQFRGEGITVCIDDEDLNLRWASKDLAERLSFLAFLYCLFSAEVSLRSSVI
ncbi:hypothetical protein GIB67_005793 [Kingdonia uniflora]|uniref:Uncharacterized protein n=1 Tax=Kingdonia uniflora TaxID=39325 RepID=A0A7J7MB88_9MAGN|nr:hypothetical protein GIB67_005793 [Kingdonia uniflora]